MICVIQRTRKAEVSADGRKLGRCGTDENKCAGLLLMVGIKSGDTEETVLKIADKILKMRIFEDENGKLNYSVKDIGGNILSISNFTLCASCRRGTRPDFTSAEKPARAKELYDLFVRTLNLQGVKTEDGEFGADMQINALLDGPVTIVIDSEKDLAQK